MGGRRAAQYLGASTTSSAVVGKTQSWSQCSVPSIGDGGPQREILAFTVRRACRRLAPGCRLLSPHSTVRWAAQCLPGSGRGSHMGPEPQLGSQHFGTDRRVLFDAPWRLGRSSARLLRRRLGSTRACLCAHHGRSVERPRPHSLELLFSRHVRRPVPLARSGLKNASLTVLLGVIGTGADCTLWCLRWRSLSAASVIIRRCQSLHNQNQQRKEQQVYYGACHEPRLVASAPRWIRALVRWHLRPRGHVPVACGVKNNLQCLLGLEHLYMPSTHALLWHILSRRPWTTPLGSWATRLPEDYSQYRRSMCRTAAPLQPGILPHPQRVISPKRANVDVIMYRHGHAQGLPATVLHVQPAAFGPIYLNRMTATGATERTIRPS